VLKAIIIRIFFGRKNEIQERNFKRKKERKESLGNGGGDSQQRNKDHRPIVALS